MENIYLFEEKKPKKNGLFLLAKRLFSVYRKTTRTNFVNTGMINTKHTKFLLIILMIMAANFASAASRFSVASGNWNSTSTWSTTSGGVAGAAVPVAGDNVTIENGYTVSLNVNTKALGVLTISSGAALTTASTFTVSATTITVNGTYNNGSTGNITGTMTVNGTYNHTGSKDDFPTATWAATSNCNITGFVGAVNIATFSGQTYGNVSYNCMGQTGAVDLFEATATTIIAGNFTINSTGSSILYFRLSGQIFDPTITINGDLIINGGTVDGNNNGGTANGSVVINIGGNYTQTGGTFNTSTAQSGASCQITFTGTTSTFNQTGGTFNSGSSRFPITVASGATLTLSSSLTLINGYNFTVNSGGTLNISSGVTLNGTGGSVVNNGTISGAGTVIGSSVIDPGTYTNLTITGSGVVTTTGVTVNGVLSMEGTATISVAITFGAGATLQYNTATARTTGVEWVSNFSGTGGITITNTGAISMNSAEVVNTNITINSGATLRTNNYDLTISGNILNSGTFTAGSSTINYNNTTGGQTIAATTYTNLTLANTSGTQTAAGNIVVSGILTTTVGGTFNLGTNTLTGSLATITNSGTTRTQNTGTAIPTGKTWGGTIQFDGVAQTVSTGTYNNLTLAGSGTKAITTATTTVNGTLSLAGTATVSAAPTYGSSATLQYYTTTDRTAGSEWVTPFVSSGGIINANTGTITIPTSVTISAPLTLTGGKIAIGANTLTLGGSFTGSATYSIQANGSGSNLTISGSGSFGTLYFDQTTSGTTNKLQNLIINRNTQTITLGNTLQVTGTLTPTAGTLASGGYLVLVSNATATAAVAAITASSDITGNVVVQRYVPSGTRRYRMLSTPTTSFTYSQLIDNIYFTGPGGSTNGFDNSTANSYTGYTYQETTTGTGRGWKGVSGISNTADPGKGLYVFVRGDRTLASPAWYTPPFLSQNSATLDFVGPLKKGSVSPALTYTNTGVSASDGWNFIGNPYASSISWSGLAKTNLSSFYYLYDPTTGSYVSNNGTTPIASGQGFFVQATASSPSITFTEAAKTSATAGYFKSANRIIGMRMIKDSVNSDVAWIEFSNSASKGFDVNEDALKFYNSAINFGMLVDDTTELQYSQTEPLSSLQDTFKLFAYAGVGAYSVSFDNITSIDPAKQITLVDAFLNVSTDLKTVSNYSFTITSNPLSSGRNRFYIVISTPSSLPVKLLNFNATKEKNEADVHIYWSTATEQNSEKFVLERGTTMDNFSKIVEIKSAGNSITKKSYDFIDKSVLKIAEAPYVYYRLKQIDKNGDAIISNTVSVLISNMVNAICVSPNPTKSYIYIAVSSENSYLEIVDIFGKAVKKTNTGLSKSVQISVSELEAGAYVVKSVSPNGEQAFTKFIKE